MKKIGFIAVFLMFFGIVSGQIEKHVFWSFSTEKISDDEYWLVFHAQIDDKWHLYSPHNPPGGALPLDIIYDNSDKFKVIGDVVETPEPKKVWDDIFEKEEWYFEGEATFKQKIKVLSEEDFTITGTLDGQVCLEDGRCINFTDPFKFEIKGVKKTQKTQNQPATTPPDTQTQTPDNTQTENKPQTTTDTQLRQQTDTQQLNTVQISVIDTTKKDTAEHKVSLKPTGYTPILVSDKNWEVKEAKKSLWWFFFVAFGLGLAALLTPCVFPMIPMTVSFFIKGKDTARGKINALIYGLSIVFIYTVPIAIIVGIANLMKGGETSLSADFANFLSTHWLPNIFFFLVFLIFAMSFFGMFEITLPYWLVNKTDKKAGQGGLIGIFFMAFTLVLVSFSCTGPIVGGILVESTQGGGLVKPLVGMLGFSLGVALPFTLFAFFPSWLQKLPKSGGWLNSVKVVLGFIELALGLKFLSVADQTYHWHILDREVYLALWIVIFGLMGLYLMGKIKFAHDSDLKYISVPRLFLIIITFAFVVYLIPGLFGAPLKPLAGYLPPKTTQEFDIERLTNNDYSDALCDKPMYADQLHLPHGLKGYFDVYQALNCAKKKNKPIFIDFTGHGCVNCRKMEEYVWSDPRVLSKLKHDFIILSLYVDDKKIQVPEDRWFVSLADGKLKKTLGKQNSDIQIYNFNKNAQPFYVLIDYKGNVLATPMEYNPNPDEFLKFLDEGLKKYKLLHPIK